MSTKERIQKTKNSDLSRKGKLVLLAHELADHFKTDIYFCEIKGKRWSFVAGSDKTVYGSWRFQLNDRWGIISTRKLAEEKDIHLINDMIRGILSD
ncbi:MAG: hypothetical protein JXR87_00155 [Candidatus Marinimicrobia bacterium]|nr:hypothetical protein [Candidatus Neomarinimicrobiota bacterium]